MDRILLGKAPANDAPYYHRDNKFGLFISKPGSNVYSCSDGDLIFDSTAASLMQTITSGIAVVPKAVYDVGIFGEEGTITDDNWDSVEPLDDLNEDTCWLYDAFANIERESNEIFFGMTATCLVSTGGVDNVTGEYYLGHPLNPYTTTQQYLDGMAYQATQGTHWEQNGKPKPVHDLNAQYAIDGRTDENYRNYLGLYFGTVGVLVSGPKKPDLLEGHSIPPFDLQPDEALLDDDTRQGFDAISRTWGRAHSPQRGGRSGTIYNDVTIK